MGWPSACAIVGAYLAGTFPTAQLVGRRAGHDPTREGSGNPGASNVYRTAGRRAGALVLLGDLLKGALPTALALGASGRWLAGWCWLASVGGHVLPVWRPRRGGKGVATAGGGALVLHPLGSIGLVALFLLVVRRSRVAALGSLTMAVLLPVVVAAEGRAAREVAVAAGVALVVVARHQGNIRRLWAGTERVLPR